MNAIPRYDVRCDVCRIEFEASVPIVDRHNVHCTGCGGPTRIVFNVPAAVSAFKADWYEHVADKPVYCSTPQELRDACDRNDGISQYLEDGVWKTSPGPDPDRGAPGDPGVYKESGKDYD